MFKIRSITFFIFSICICSLINAMETNALGSIVLMIDGNQNTQEPQCSTLWLSENFDLDTVFELKDLSPNKITFNTQETILILACRHNKEEIVQRLISYPDLRTNFQDKNGNTALHHACLNCNINIAKMLLATKDIDVTIKNVDGKRPVNLAILGMQSFDEDKARQSTTICNLLNQKSKSLIKKESKL